MVNLMLRSLSHGLTFNLLSDLVIQAAALTSASLPTIIPFLSLVGIVSSTLLARLLKAESLFPYDFLSSSLIKFACILHRRFVNAFIELSILAKSN